MKNQELEKRGHNCLWRAFITLGTFASAIPNFTISIIFIITSDPDMFLVKEGVLLFSRGLVIATV